MTSPTVKFANRGVSVLTIPHGAAAMSVELELADLTTVYLECARALRHHIEKGIQLGTYDSWPDAREQLGIEHYRKSHRCTACGQEFLSCRIRHGGCTVIGAAQEEPEHWEYGADDVINEGRVDAYTVEPRT